MKTRFIGLGVFFSFLFFSNEHIYARDYYGAIYVDETTGIAGSSWNYGTEEKAKREALNSCKLKSGKKSCELIAWWANSCVAAAWSPSKKSARRGDAIDTQISAEKSAIARCKLREKDPACKVVASVCTNWETEEVIWW